MATQTTEVASTPTLTLSCARERAKPGESIDYRIQFANTDSKPLTNVQIVTQLPDNVTLLQADDAHIDEQSNLLSWTIPTVEAGGMGEVQISVRVAVKEQPAESLEWRAAIRSDQTQPVESVAQSVQITVPELLLKHDVSLAQATPGDVVLHTLAYQCPGTAAVTRARLTAEIPKFCTFVSASAGGKPDSRGKRVQWTLGSLAAGAQDSVMFSVRVDPTLSEGSHACSSRSMLRATEIADPIECLSATTHIHASPTLTAQLQGPTQELVPGGAFPLTMTLVNTGNATAKGLTARLHPLARTKVLGAAGANVAASGGTEWTMADVAAGESATFDWQLELDSTFPTGTTALVPTVTVIRGNSSPIVAKSPPVHVVAQPMLTPSIVVDQSEAVPGAPITITATVTNAGSAVAKNVTGILPIPKYSDVIADQSTVTVKRGTKDAMFRIATLQPGCSETFQLVVALHETFPPGQTTLQTQLSCKTAKGRTSKSDLIAVLVNASPDLQWSITPTAQQAQPGDRIRYTLNAKNNGHGLVEDLRIRVAVPDGLRISSTDRGLRAQSDDGGLLWALGDVRAQHEAEAGFTVQLPATLDKAKSQFTVGGEASWAHGSTSMASKTIEVIGQTLLSATARSMSAVTKPGDSFLVHIAVRNDGNAPSTNTQLRIEPEAGVAPHRTGANVSREDNVTVYDLESLPPGEETVIRHKGVLEKTFAPGETTVPLRMVLRADHSPEQSQETVLTTVVASAEKAETTAAENQRRGSAVAVSPPTLTLSCARNNVRPGETIDLRLQFANTGITPLTQLVLETQWPNAVELVRAENANINEQDRSLTWTIQRIEAGGMGEVSASVRVAAQEPLSKSIEWKATLLSNETDRVEGVAAPVQIIAPQLLLNHEVSLSQATPGDVVLHTLTVQSPGTAAITRTRLTADIPAHCTFVSASAGGKADRRGKRVQWNLGSLAPSARDSVMFTVRVNSNVPEGQHTIGSHSTLRAAEMSQPIECESPTTLISASPLLTAQLHVPSGDVVPGARLPLTLTVNNDGNANAVGLSARLHPLPRTNVLGADSAHMSASGGTEWTIGDVPAGEAATFDWQLEMDAAFPTGTTALEPTVSVTHGNEHPLVAKSDPIRVVAQPVLVPVLTVMPGVAAPGAQVAYTATVTNAGSADAKNVTAIVPIPKLCDVDVEQSTATVNRGSKDALLRIPSLAAGASETFDIVVSLNDTFPVGETELTTRLACTAANAVATESDTVPVLVTAESDFQWTIASSASEAQPGDRIRFEVQANNHGPGLVDDLRIRLTIPKELRVSSTDRGLRAQRNDGELLWTLGKVGTHQGAKSSFTVQLPATYDGGENLLSIQGEATWAEGTSVATSEVIQITACPQLNVSVKPMAGTTKPGDSFSVHIAVRNDGTAPSTGTELLIEQEPGVTPFLKRANVSKQDDGIVYALESLAPGEETVVRHEGTLATTFAGGETAIPLRMVLISNESPRADHESTLTTVKAAANHSIQVSADRAKANPGETVTYTVVCANSGNAHLVDLTIQCRIPDEMRVITATGGDERQTTDCLQWHINQLRAGETIKLGLVARLVDVFPLGQTKVQCDFEQRTTNEDAQAVTGPALLVSAKPEPMVLVSTESKTLTFDKPTRLLVEVSNAGNAAGSNATLECAVPKGLVVLDASSEGVVGGQGRMVRWSLDDVPACSGVIERWIEISPDGIFQAGDSTLMMEACLKGKGFNAVRAEPLPLTVNAQPLLLLESSFGPENACPGEEVVLQLTYRNVGHAHAYQAEVINPLPPRSEFISASAKGTFDELSNAIQWNLERIPVGGSGQVSATLRLDSVYPDGYTTITNAASIGATECPMNLGPENDIVVQAVPELALSMDADCGAVRPGENMVLSVYCHAMGSAPATDGNISLNLPPEVAIIDTTENATFDADTTTLSWAMDRLDPGQTFAAAVTLQLTSTLPPSMDECPFTLQGGTKQTGPVPAVQWALPIDASSDCVLAIHCEEKAWAPGETVALTVDVRNDGNTDADGVIVSLSLPKDLESVVEQTEGDWVFEESGLRWDLGCLEVGASYSQVASVRLDAVFTAGETPLSITGSIASSDGSTVGQSSLNLRVHAEPKLVVSTESSHQSAEAGESVDFRFSIRNAGSAAARSVRAIGHVPPGLSVVSANRGGTVCPDQGMEVEWTIDSIPMEEVIELTFQATLDADRESTDQSLGTFLELASPDLHDRIVGKSVDLSVANPVESESQPLVTSQLFVADHDVSWGDGSHRQVDAMPGSSVTLEWIITNGGKDPSDALVANLSSDVGSIRLTTSDRRADQEENALSWALEALEAGNTHRLTVQATIADQFSSGRHRIPMRGVVDTNAFSAVEDCFDFVVEAAPQVHLNVVPDRAQLTPGDDVQLTVPYRISGSSDADDLTIMLPIPAACDLVDISDGGEMIKRGREQVVRWTPGLTALGDEGLVRCVVNMPPKRFDSVQTVSFQARAQAQSMPNCQSDSMDVQVTPRPEIAISVAADRAEAKPGDRIGYTLRIENTGLTTIKGMALSNPLPPRCQYASGTEGGSYDEPTDSVIWQLPAIAVGASVSVGWTAELEKDFPLGETTITNLVVAHIDGEEPIESGETATVVLSMPKLSGTLAIEPNHARPGNTVVGTVSCNNIGSATAERVSAIIRLPKGLRAESAANEGRIQRNGRDIRWTWDTLSALDEVATSFEVRIDSIFPTGDFNLPLKLSVDAKNVEKSTEETELVVQSSPNLELITAVDTAQAAPGGLLRYTLQLDNSGEVAANDVLLVFPVLAECTVEHVSVPTTHTELGGPLRWHFDAIAPEHQETIHVDVRVATDFAAGDTLLEVRPSVTTHGEPLKELPSPLQTTVHAAPKVVGHLTLDEASLEPKDLLTLTLTLTNDGDADAQSVGMLFPLPPRLDFSGSEGAPIRYQRTKRLVEFVAGDLRPGQSLVAKVRAQLEDTFPAGVTMIPLRARYGVESGEAVWTEPVECSVTAMPILVPEIAVANEAAIPGDSVRCQVQVHNQGNAPGDGCQLMVHLPDRMTLANARGGTFDPEARTIVWPLKKLRVDGTQAFPFILEVSRGFPAGSSQLMLSAETNGETIEATEASTTLWVDATPSMELTLETDVEETVPNSDIRYVLRVKNEGNALAEDVLVTLTLPPRTQLLDGGPEASYHTSAGKVEWPIARIEEGETNELAALVRLADAFPAGTTVLAARASVRAKHASASPDVGMEIPVHATPVLELNSQMPEEEASPGDTLEYELQWKNSGSAAATNTRIIGQLAAHTTTKSVSAGAQEAGPTGPAWDLGAVPAGASGKIHWNVEISSAIDPGTHNVAPTFVVTCHEAPHLDIQVKPVLVQAQPNITVDVQTETSVATADVETRVSTRTSGTKQQITQENTQQIAIGALLSFKLSISNQGNAVAKDTEINYDLPPGALFVSASDDGRYDARKHCVLWNVGDVPAGATGLVRTAVVRYGG